MVVPHPSLAYPPHIREGQGKVRRRGSGMKCPTEVYLSCNALSTEHMAVTIQVQKSTLIVHDVSEKTVQPWSWILVNRGLVKHVGEKNSLVAWQLLFTVFP
jgi:hypothetical protein